MSATLKAREVSEVLILDIAGRITLGLGAGSLRDVIRQYAKEGKKEIILNLAETMYVDSSGVGELVSGFILLNNQGAQLKLLALTKQLRDVLHITKLYTVFEVFDNEAEAVRSFVLARPSRNFS